MRLEHSWCYQIQVHIPIMWLKTSESAICLKSHVQQCGYLDFDSSFSVFWIYLFILLSVTTSLIYL
jgi:hypothetical protein